MSEEQNNPFDPNAADDNGAADLTDALGGEETSFVTEQAKPANRSTVVIFGLVLAAIGATYVMFLRSGPKPAGADTAHAAEAADETINDFLSKGEANKKLMEDMLKSTQKVVQQFLSYPSKTQVPLSELKTNPFRHTALKSKDGDANTTSAKRKREEERVAMLKAVQTLQLQTIMHGEVRKACMINNTLYQEGQQVEGFTIEKIAPAGVVVRNGQYRFELKMQKK